MRQYIGKLLKVYRSANSLISVAASRRLRPFFEDMPSLVFVPSSSRQVSFDLSKPPEAQKLLFDTLELSGTCSYEEPPHCECGLLAYLLENNIASMVDPVIGVSRQSCFGCMAWFKAVNAALKSKVGAIGLIIIICLTNRF